MSFNKNQFKYGSKSLHHLKTLDPRWGKILNEAIKHFDISILCGYRNEKDQMRAFNSGRSTLMYPLSKHNENPSIAVDLAIWPIKWEDYNMFFQLAGCIKTIASQQGVKIKWGGDWKVLKDYVHFEIIDS